MQALVLNLHTILTQFVNICLNKLLEMSTMQLLPVLCLHVILGGSIVPHVNQSSFTIDGNVSPSIVVQVFDFLSEWFLFFVAIHQVWH